MRRTGPVGGLVGLLVLAVASGYLFWRARPADTAIETTPELGVGYYAEDARVSITDEDGELVVRVSARSAVQEPTDGGVNLQDVTIDYDPAADLPWTLTASEGRIRAGVKMVELSGDVVATTREADGPAATIRTDFLEFDPDTSIAATDRSVVVEYAGSTVRAVGLRAALREDRLELLADVTGRYEQ